MIDLSSIINSIQAINPQRDIDDYNQVLASISQLALAPKLRFYYARIDDLREQDVNANSMPKRMFDQLVENIKAAGGLESLPLCAKIAAVGEQIWLVSGHHRTRSARQAGHTHLMVLLYEGLDWDAARAKQLAHNSIAGTSDPELVKRIWDQIESATARFEAFIDTRMFDEIPQTVSFKPVDVDFADLSKTVMVVFLSSQYQDMEAAVEAVMPKGELDAVYLAHRDTYEQFTQMMKRTRAELDIKAIPTAFAEIMRLALERLDELAEENAAVEGAE
jgi:hypothetical protein